LTVQEAILILVEDMAEDSGQEVMMLVSSVVAG
jgi:hypothetical protein